jgi:hypothetical protein
MSDFFSWIIWLATQTQVKRMTIFILLQFNYVDKKKHIVSTSIIFKQESTKTMDEIATSTTVR